MGLEDDVLKLKEYMEKHLDNLEHDIENAEKKESKVDAEFYEGAKSATTLFVHLISDIIKKNGLKEQ